MVLDPGDYGSDTAPHILWSNSSWHTKSFFIYSHREKAMPYQYYYWLGLF